MTLLGRTSGLHLSEDLLNKLDGKSLLVTGASGVVGLNMLALISEAIHKEQLHVRVLGMSRTGELPVASRLSTPIRIEKINLLDFQQVSELPPFDFIIHGATYGQPARFLAKPADTILLNTQVTAQLKGLAKERFLFVSSSEVYSGLDNAPFTESQIGTTNTGHPRAPYIEAKRSGEALTLASLSPGAPGSVARLSLAYGPGARADDKRVLYQLIVRGIQNHRVDLRGGGDSIRSYLFAEDAALYLLTLLINGKDEIYNVGGSQPISLRGLGENIANILGVDFDSVSTPVATTIGNGAPEDVRLDMTRTRTLVGRFDETALVDGLEATIEWMRLILSESENTESTRDGEPH